MSRLPVTQCRIRGISNGNNLVQSLFTIPLPVEEQHVFSNSILYLCIWQLADVKPIKTQQNTLSSPSRQRPMMPAVSTLQVFTSRQCVLSTASLTSSLCRQPGRGGIHHCQARSLSSVPIVSSSLHSACSSAITFLFVHIRGKKN